MSFDTIRAIFAEGAAEFARLEIIRAAQDRLEELRRNEPQRQYRLHRDAQLRRRTRVAS